MKVIILLLAAVLTFVNSQTIRAGYIDECTANLYLLNTTSVMISSLSNQAVASINVSRVSIASVTSVSQLTSFDVLICMNGGDVDGIQPADVWTVINDYVAGGRGLVYGSWFFFAAYDPPSVAPLLPSLPHLNNPFGNYGYCFTNGGETITLNTTHPIAAGISSLTAIGGNGITSSDSRNGVTYKPGTEIVGTLSTCPAPSNFLATDTIVAYSGNNGRTVHLGGMFTAPRYNNWDQYRVDPWNRLLVNSIVYAANLSGRRLTTTGSVTTGSVAQGTTGAQATTGVRATTGVAVSTTGRNSTTSAPTGGAGMTTPTFFLPLALLLLLIKIVHQ